MPNTKISALTAGNPALSTDALPIARSGANYQVTAASVASLVNRLAAITASATPVVLTVSSAPVSNVSGSGGQVIQLPNATTLTVGTIFRFDNNQTSGAITVNNNSGTLVVSVPSGSYVEVTLLTNGTAAGTWDRHDLAPSNVSWSTNTFDYPGSITSATWNGVTVATNRGGTGLASFTSGGAVYATSTSALATGTLPATAGGTGNASYAVGDLVYASTTTALSRLADVATGNALISGGVGVAPSYGKIGLTTHVSGTLPPGSGGTGAIGTPANGQLLIGNGTNYSVANLTAGSNITITNSAGGISIASAGGVASFSAGTTGFSPNTATTGAITLTGTLATTNGGTNLTSFTSGGAVYATSTSVLTTGTLPLASGGTGQTTKAAAFNALSPVTTTGDLILGNGTNSSTRLPIGTNGYVLTSNGTTASWQAGGGGGGVTSFDAGSTGFSPSGTTTGAITLSGTLNTGNGGTGTGTTPSNGQLLIGNGGGYSVNNLTAGSGVTITNSFGNITIAATGGGGPTINVLSVSTSSGSFNNSPPSSTYSKPLIGYNVTGSSYGAFFFQSFSGGNFVTSFPTINSIAIQDSTGGFASYTNGTDYFGGSFSVYDSVVACYGVQITNAAMQTLFSDSKAAITSPSVAPLDAFSGGSFSNPTIYLLDTLGNPYGSSDRGITVNKFGPNFVLAFGSNNTTPAFVTVSSIQFTINGSSTTYNAGTDFTASGESNSSNGMFIMQISPSNPTLTTLLTNSFL